MSADSSPTVSPHTSPPGSPSEEAGSRGSDASGISREEASKVKFFGDSPILKRSLSTDNLASSSLKGAKHRKTALLRRSFHSSDFAVARKRSSSKQASGASPSLTGVDATRFDFVLKSGTVSEYASMFSAHRSYWSNRDLMWFVLKRLQQSNQP